jgi:FtsZ-binding cell division protein ZapB
MINATETVKDFIRVAQTAGLSKDVIDLLEKKVALLAEQVASLEQENSTLLRENRNLHLVNEDLKKQLDNARPKGDELDELSTKILVSLANFQGGNAITDRELIQQLGIPKAKGDYHFDQLRNRKFIHSSSGAVGRGAFYFATTAGREYLATHGLL